MAATVGVGRGPGDGSRAVAIGGGHGLSRCLRALTHVVDHVTAVVTVADDGGSSGRLRRDLGVVPPGDLRMAIAALSPRRDLVDLLQYRFAAGELAGHSLGNLIIVAAAALNGDDLIAGLDRVTAILGCQGRVLPCSTQPLSLRAQVGGQVVWGQVRVAESTRVERVAIAPADAPATPQAVAAIRRADLVVLGPGSLYTSIVPNLLVPGIGAAVAAARAPVVLVANLREQPGETQGMDLAEHAEALRDHVPDVGLSALVAHDGPAPQGEGLALKADPVALASYADEIVTADLLDGSDGHDPAKLAVALRRTLHGSG